MRHNLRVLGVVLLGCLVGAICIEAAQPAKKTARRSTTAESTKQAGSSSAKNKSPTANKRDPAGWPDPIEQNGPIFKGWPDPKLALVMTGEQLGYIEPCGCAGLENQKGGLRRRDTFLKQLAKRGWPIIALDNGGLIRRFGREAETKYRRTVDGLKLMDYKAVGFGTEDLKLPGGALLSAVADAELFVSANVAVLDKNLGIPPPYRVIESGGMKVGVTAILGDGLQKQVTNKEVIFKPAKKALEQVVSDLKQEKCDLYVLLAHATLKEATALAEAFPLFQVAVIAHGADEPPHEATKFPGTDTLLIEVGHKAMYAITLGFYDDKQEPVRYQRVPLDHRFADSEEMDKLMVDYQAELEQLGWSGLGLRPAPNPAGKFVGSKACANCHKDEFAIWQKTPHALATDTLLHAKPPRQFDPECVSCHTTGWNPQEFFPYQTGYDGLKTTPLLVGSGCENCHGPGSGHVSAEKGNDDARKSKWRDFLASTSTGATKEAQRESCMRCHDIDNSPDFDFDAYWARVKH